MKLKVLGFWTAFTMLLSVVTISGLEFLSSFAVPSWPARELRPIFITSDVQSTPKNAPKPVLSYNSWGVRDWERSIRKPDGADFRAVLVGDSFLEGGFVDKPVGAQIEDLWSQGGQRNVEAINLGISATDPPQYFYRIQNVALSLQPDAILLLFYSGNDFVIEGYLPGEVPPLIAARPMPSWLGTVAPRLTWLAVNRARLSNVSRATTPIDEFQILNLILEEPLERRYDSLARFMKQNYLPDLDEAVIRRVLARAGDSFWDTFSKRTRDQEYLQGWWIAGLVRWEAGGSPDPDADKDIARFIDQSPLKQTLSWLVGAHDLARKHGVKFLIALAPSAMADPHYNRFWEPWPTFTRTITKVDSLHPVFRTMLEANGLPIVDLADDLRGVPGSYRISDGHWTQLGTDIAAKRLAKELLKLRGGAPGQ
jgi:hypothetical protein